MIVDENCSTNELSPEFKVKKQSTSARLYMWWLDERLRNCFVKDTEIMTVDGKKSIQNFEVGDYVLG